MKKQTTITIPASEIDGIKYNSFEISVLFQLVPEPMKLGENRMDWLKNQKIKPVSIEITTVKDMKKSERLHAVAQSEGNDYRALGMHMQAFREERRENNKERFDKDFLPLLKKLYVVEENTDFCKIHTQTFGLIVVYPKSNKLNVCRRQKWYLDAREWITKNLFNGMK